jgi:hypothetical protein
MNYKEKYIKYKSKYLDLKKQLGSGILDNPITKSDCVSPEFVRVIKNEDDNKLVILLGESHKKVDLYQSVINNNNKNIIITRRNNKDMGYDKYIGLISKKLSIAKANKDGTHGDDPFQKVLYLMEFAPNLVLLGGKKELEPDLFEIKHEKVLELGYVYDRLQQISDKYKPNMLVRNYDIRARFDMVYVMPDVIIQAIEENIDNLTLQKGIDHALEMIEKYIINDEVIDPPSLEIFEPGFESKINTENRQFFTETYNRPSFTTHKRFTTIFRNNIEIFNHLKNILKEEIKDIKTNPKIFTDPSFNDLDIYGKFKIYNDRYANLNDLVSRIMDLYGLEYIHEMPKNSTTVIISGSSHTNYIFSHLCLLNNYKLLESEKKYNNRIDANLYNCVYYYPYENDDEINQFNQIIKETRDELLSTNPDRKKKFYENMLSQMKYRIYINEKIQEFNPLNLLLANPILANIVRQQRNKIAKYTIGISKSIETVTDIPPPPPGSITVAELAKLQNKRDLIEKDTLIERYGTFFKLLKRNKEKLFTTNVKSEYIFEEY